MTLSYVTRTSFFGHVSSFKSQPRVRRHMMTRLLFLFITTYFINIHRTVRSRAMLFAVLLYANQDVNPSLVFLENPLMTGLLELFRTASEPRKVGTGLDYLQPERTVRVTCSMRSAIHSLMKKHRASSTCEEPRGSPIGTGTGTRTRTLYLILSWYSYYPTRLHACIQPQPSGSCRCDSIIIIHHSYFIIGSFTHM